MVKISKENGAKNAGVKLSRPKKTYIALEDIRSVRFIETANGEKKCRLNLSDGTWIELISTGVSSAETVFETTPIVNRSSFDFKATGKHRSAERVTFANLFSSK
jgi:hypothetical protein